MSSRPGPRLGDPGRKFADVQRIALLRGGGLGDLMFALPAAESLAVAYPDAEITLLGMPLHAALLQGRPSPFSAVELLPARPGIRDGVQDPALSTAFVERMRGRQFDLAVQVHGGGRNSNPFLLELGARHTVGTRTEDAAPLERSLPYLYYQHEVLRALEVVGLAGAYPVDLEPRLRLTEAERALRHQARPPGTPRTVVLHPGATDPRRRWPTTSFAELATALAADGADVVVVGDASEVALAEDILARVPADLPGQVSSAAGAASMAELVTLLLRASLVVANDSGPRHLAAALGTSTVGIYWFGNAVNAGSLSRSRHRLQLAWTTHCPVCGVDATSLTAERCPHDDSFVAAVPVPAVLADARALIATASPSD